MDTVFNFQSITILYQQYLSVHLKLLKPFAKLQMNINTQIERDLNTKLDLRFQTNHNINTLHESLTIVLIFYTHKIICCSFINPFYTHTQWKSVYLCAEARKWIRDCSKMQH